MKSLRVNAVFKKIQCKKLSNCLLISPQRHASFIITQIENFVPNRKKTEENE